MFKKTNANPKNKRTNDCVIRAIALAENKTWLEVFDELTKLARENTLMMNDKRLYEKHLALNGWHKEAMPKEDGRRITVRRFAEKYGGSALIRVVSHLTYLDEEGTLLDTWDCSHKCVGNYWIK